MICHDDLKRAKSKAEAAENERLQINSEISRKSNQHRDPRTVSAAAAAAAEAAAAAVVVAVVSSLCVGFVRIIYL